MIDAASSWWWRYQLFLVLVVQRVILRVVCRIDLKVLRRFGVAARQGFLVHGHGAEQSSICQLRLRCLLRVDDDDKSAGAGFLCGMKIESMFLSEIAPRKMIRRNADSEVPPAQSRSVTSFSSRNSDSDCKKCDLKRHKILFVNLSWHSEIG